MPLHAGRGDSALFDEGASACKPAWACTPPVRESNLAAMVSFRFV